VLQWMGLFPRRITEFLFLSEKVTELRPNIARMVNRQPTFSAWKKCETQSPLTMKNLRCWAFWE
jgi:hypothetical protein